MTRHTGQYERSVVSALSIVHTVRTILRESIMMVYQLLMTLMITHNIHKTGGSGGAEPEA
jgi:hypothetical protein